MVQGPGRREEVSHVAAGKARAKALRPSKWLERLEQRGAGQVCGALEASYSE